MMQQFIMTLGLHNSTEWLPWSNSSIKCLIRFLRTNVIHNLDKHNRIKTSNIYFGKKCIYEATNTDNLGLMVQFLFPTESWIIVEDASLDTKNFDILIN